MNLSTLNTGLIFESLFISFVISILTALISTKFAIRTNLLDRPNAEPHKKHKYPVPVSGGTALFLTLLIMLLIFRSSITAPLWGLTLSALIIYCFSLYDDYHHLKWKVKLGGQILGTAVLILTGTRTHLFEAKLFSNLLPAGLVPVCDILLTFF